MPTATGTEGAADLLRWALLRLAEDEDLPDWARFYADAVLKLEREVYGDE